MGIAYNTSIVTNGLVFALDAANTRSYAGSGNAAYALLGGYSGTLSNGVGFTSADNGSFVFDGTNDYINFTERTVETELQYNTPFTISILCYITENSVAGHILNNRLVDASGVNYCGWVIMQNDGYIWCLIGGYPGGSAGWRQVSISTGSFDSLVYNKWCQIVFLNTGIAGEQKIFLNGVNHTSSASDFSNPPYTINYSNGSSRLYIGYGALNEHPTSARVSQVMIYNRALTQQEIKQNYNATKKRYGL